MSLITASMAVWYPSVCGGTESVEHHLLRNHGAVSGFTSRFSSPRTSSKAELTRGLIIAAMREIPQQMGSTIKAVSELRNERSLKNLNISPSLVQIARQDQLQRESVGPCGHPDADARLHVDAAFKRMVCDKP